MRGTHDGRRSLLVWLHWRTIRAEVSTVADGPQLQADGVPVMHYTQDDYNVALGIGMLAGLMVGGAIGFILCAILVRAMGI
jgi:hypothetical protein